MRLKAHNDEEGDVERTGGDDDHVRKRGTMGKVSKRRVLERMRENGMIGRCI